MHGVAPTIADLGTSRGWYPRRVNTQAHATLNLALLGTGAGPGHVLPVLAGSVLPDAPMFVFYAWQKLAVGASEQEIWGSLFFEARWQDFFDVFNSLPLAAAGAVGAHVAGYARTRLLFAAMLLHQLCDLPLHAGEDAHRHFLPLSSFRFASPLSYWDPAHHALWVAPVELGLAVAACAVLVRRYPGRISRIGVGLVVGSYAAMYGGLALWMALA